MFPLGLKVYKNWNLPVQSSIKIKTALSVISKSINLTMLLLLFIAFHIVISFFTAASCSEDLTL